MMVAVTCSSITAIVFFLLSLIIFFDVDDNGTENISEFDNFSFVFLLSFLEEMSAKYIYHAAIEDVNFETELLMPNTDPEPFTRTLREFISEVSPKLLRSTQTHTGRTDNDDSNINPDREPVLCHGCKTAVATQLIHRPMLFEQVVPPRIEDIISPVCGKASCTLAVHEEIEGALKEENQANFISPRVGAILYACAHCGRYAGKNDDVGRADSRPNGQFKRCSRCKTVWYCDANCQKSHWSKHKAICGK